jgi:hypothetical protein
VEGMVLWKDGDVGRRGGSGKMVAVSFNLIREWSEMLLRRTMWRGCYDESWVGDVSDHRIRFGWYIGA